MGRKQYQTLIQKFLPTIQKVCKAEEVPYQICFAQLLVESGGKSDLAKKHNYFGLKFPRGKRWKTQWEWLGQPGKFQKMTPERINVRNRSHFDRLVDKGAVFSDEEWSANPTFPSSQSLRLPQLFCTFSSLEAGVKGWCRFMKRSRYQDGGILANDPVRWIAYRWMRGYATADFYVEAVVKRMQRVFKYTDDPAFDVEISEDLDELLDEARRLGPGVERWELAKDALEANSFQNIFPHVEVLDFSEPLVVEVDHED